MIRADPNPKTTNRTDDKIIVPNIHRPVFSISFWSLSLKHAVIIEKNSKGIREYRPNLIIKLMIKSSTACACVLCGGRMIANATPRIAPIKYFNQSFIGTKYIIVRVVCKVYGL